MSNNEEDVFMDYIKQFALLGSLAMVILWVVVILTSFFASFGAPIDTAAESRAIDDRLKAIEVVAVKGEVATADAAAEKQAPAADDGVIDANAIVTATCAACHSIGLLESPKIGDKAAWNKRMEALGGMDGLVKSSIAGKGAMPPRGGNAALSDAEIKAAIEFMMQ